MLISTIVSFHLALSGASAFTFEADDKKQATAQDTVKEQPVIKTDKLERKLRNATKQAFKAYNNGDFEKAEKYFSVLANKQFIALEKQKRGRESFETLGRGSTLSRVGLSLPDDWDGDNEAYVAGSRAKSRSIYTQSAPTSLWKTASKLFFVKGVTELQQSKSDEAQNSFQKAIRFNKSNIEARIEHVLIDLRMGNFKDIDVQLKSINIVFKKLCKNKNKCAEIQDSQHRFEKIQLAYNNMKKTQ